VFKAEDTKCNNKVKALKVITYSDECELNAILKEGTQLMNISHPHILKVNDFFIDKDQLLCIDMDFYPNGDLTSLIEKQQDTDESIIKQITFQMCQALDFVHSELNIIHRDVKPSNIFIKELTASSIEIVLADFGLAKVNHQSVNNSYAGTPLFMSPELGLGGKYYTNTDIYSLGVTVYQLITKDTTTAINPMYLSRKEKEVMDWLRKRLKEAGNYSDELIDLCLFMLTKEATSRPYAQDILSNHYFYGLN